MGLYVAILNHDEDQIWGWGSSANERREFKWFFYSKTGIPMYKKKTNGVEFFFNIYLQSEWKTRSSSYLFFPLL